MNNTHNEILSHNIVLFTTGQLYIRDQKTIFKQLKGTVRVSKTNDKLSRVKSYKMGVVG